MLILSVIVKCNEGSYTEKYKDHIPCSFAYRFTKPTINYRGENAAYEFIKAVLEEYKYCKKVMEEYFNKNLIMAEEEENLFQKSNSCWICKKFINNNEEKVRDHCYVTGKFRGAAHRKCNLYIKLTNKVPVRFHNLRGYDSHLIFNELDKFDVRIKVIPNGLEKYMAFFLNQNLVFVDSMRFMNCSLDKLVKNLLDKDFKYLIEEFGSEYLELLKQKGAYSYEYTNSCERFNEEKLPAKKKNYSSLKDGKIGDPCHYFSSPGLSWNAI